LECAKILNNSNLSVLIIEKNLIIGPNVCAGGLCGDLDINFKSNSYLHSDNFKIILENKLIVNKLHNSFGFKTINRSELGNLQLSKISNSKTSLF
jgi:hypothetical protein